MRILLVSDYAYPSGGAEMMVRFLRDELRARGHDARVFATAVEAKPGENFADYRCFGTTSRLRTLLQTINPWASAALARALTDFAPDIVHVRLFLTQLSPLVLDCLEGHRALYHLAWRRAICPTGGKMLPTGAACEEHWGAPCLKHKCVPPHHWPLLMMQLKMTHARLHRFGAIVANSAFVQAAMARDDVACEVIHNGVPIREPEPVPRAAQPTILFAGRLAPEKGCQILLPALQRVAERAPEAKLLIAGAGPYRRTLEALCAELRLVDRVTFLGHLDQAALRAYTRRAWLQVVPSLWDEPFGVAALDAMVQARPVIASASGGLREIVEDGVSGLLAAPGDVAALAARMSELLLDAGRCETMGAAGRTRLVERFSIARCVDDFLALYARLSSS